MASKSSKVDTFTVVKEYLIEQLGEPQRGQKLRPGFFEVRTTDSYNWKINCRDDFVHISIGKADKTLSVIQVRSAGSQTFTITDGSVKWDFGGDELLLIDPNFFYKFSYDIARAMACASAGVYTHSCIGWMAQNEIEPHLKEYIKEWKSQ